MRWSAAVFGSYLDLLSDWTTAVLVFLLVAWLIRRARGPVGRGAPAGPVVACSIFTVVLVLATAAHPNGLPVSTWSRGTASSCWSSSSSAMPSPARSDPGGSSWCTLRLCGRLRLRAPRGGPGQARVLGRWENPDDLAFFLLAANPLAAALRTERRWRSQALVGLIAVAVLGTGSRAALVALVAMVVLSVVLGEVSWRAAAALVVLAGTGAACVVALVPHSVSDRLTDQQRYVETRRSPSGSTSGGPRPR